MHKIDSISVVIPVYDEAGSIVKVVTELKTHIASLGFPFEIIVVDDASQDNIEEMVPKEDIKLLKHTYNMGYGASLKTGIRNAKYSWILIIDADGSYPVEATRSLVEKVDESTDMVIASRTGKGSYFSLSREPAKFILKVLSEYLTGYKIKDLNSGMRLFKKELAISFMRILPSQFSFTTTLTLAALCNDHIVKYVDISYRKRIGRSKINPLRDVANFLALIFRTVIYFNPLKIFAPLSIFLFLIAIGVSFLSKIIFGKIADITVLLLILSGIQILSIGLLADLIDKRISKD